MTAEPTTGPSLHIARRSGGVDIDAARQAAADFLAALGIDVDREDLRETPARMARAYAELFGAQPLRLTTFANDEGYDELVLARATVTSTLLGTLRADPRSRAEFFAPGAACRAEPRIHPGKDDENDRSTH